MKLRRLSLPPLTEKPRPGLPIVLDTAQSHHGLDVLRLSPNDLIEVTSPFGLAPARILATSKGPPPKLTITLTSVFQTENHIGPRLALALVRSGRFDWAVEKATELGAVELIPIYADRGLFGKERVSMAKTERWQRLTEEARKQCGRPWPMTISKPIGISDFLAQSKEEPGPKILLTPDGQNLCQNFLNFGPSPLILIGPEGGFSPREKQEAIISGFEAVQLGSVVLKTETAALAILALFMAIQNKNWP